MAQTLSSQLAAAMLLTERNPIVEVLSDKFVPDIPFTGQRLTTDFPDYSGDGDATNEISVNSITLSDGRLAVVTTFGDIDWGYQGTHIRLTLSDPTRTTFTDYDLQITGETDAVIVEMADGNLGLMTARGYYFKINVTDNPGAVTSLGHFGTSGLNDRMLLSVVTSPAANSGHIALIRLASGTYLFAYVADPGATHTAIAIKISTSSDFITWSTPTAISMPSLDPTHAIYNPFLFQSENGDINLLFEYVEAFSGAFGTTEKVNIYHYVSTNGGTTWAPAAGASAAGAITYYPDFSVTARHPYAIPLGAGSWRISYSEVMSALHMGTSAYGWEGSSTVRSVHFDEVSRLAYVVNYTIPLGDLSSIVVVNPDTWQPVKTIWAESAPTFSSLWFNGGGMVESLGERELTIIRKGNHIGIYNSETDQCTEFHFQDNATYGVTTNISPRARGTTGGPGGAEQDMSIARMFLDYENRILYLYWQIAYQLGSCLGVGKIDLTQSGPEYTHDVMFTKSSNPPGFGFEYSPAEMTALGGAAADFKVYPDIGLIVITGGWDSNIEGLGGPWYGVTALYSMGGDLIKHFNAVNSDTYPYRGLQKVARAGGFLYGIFHYEPLYGNENRRGLAALNLADLSISYYRPTFDAVDEYTFNNLIAVKDGAEILVSSGSYGLSRFVVADSTWTDYVNATLPGLFPGETQSCESIAYDEEMGSIFIGSYANEMLIYFNEDGYFSQPQYLDAVFSGSAWEYGSAAALITGRRDRDLAMTTDPGSSGGMYAFWIHINSDGTQRVRWDIDHAEFDLTDYLLGGSSVVIKRSIDGSPAKLSFSVTHGHLFDPHNVDSLWSPVLKKYRRIKVRFGETVSGVPYWHDAGTFVVISSKMSYQRGSYPTMQVEAEDIRTWWEDAEIVATEHYEATPETILTDILTTPAWGGMDGGDVVIPEMEGSYEIWFQWLDTSVKKVVDALCNRFGYFPTIRPDGKFTARKISNANAVDHTYPNGTQIVSFSPDDDFSDFINRVIVTGETRDFMDVLYEEEAVGQLYGTSGWWGNKQTFDVWYSEDHKRKAKNPRLVILESVVANAFIAKLGGGSESIVSVDQDEFFCTVLVELPDMSTAAWIAGAVCLIVGIAACVAGIWYPSTGFGMLIGWMITLSALLYILSGIVNWQYEIWARPFGQQRIGCSGQADDVDLQSLLGRVNEKKIDEPLAITAPQCQWVADHELMIVMAQRNRVKLEKIAHLQDEEGDTLILPHPHSGKNMTIFVTDLTRSFPIPSGDPAGEGGFTDSIEGWKVAPL